MTSRVKKIRPLFGSGWHIPDELRVGTMAGLLGYDRRFREHVLGCYRCRPSLRELYLKLSPTSNTKVTKAAGSVPCVMARKAVVIYLEEGIVPPENALAHLAVCRACTRCFWQED